MTWNWQRIGLVTGSTVLGLVVILGFLWWRGGRPVRHALSLKEQLLAAESMSRPQRNRLLTELLRTVDEMDRSQLRDLQQVVRQQQGESMSRALQEYRLATGSARQAILDREIDRWIAQRDVYAALQSNPMRGRGRGGRGRGRPNTERRNPASENNGNAADADGPTREELREYWTAFRQRAEERDVPLGRRRRG